MGKILIEIPIVSDTTIIARDFVDAIQKLFELKRTAKNKKDLSLIKQFKGIANHKDIEFSDEEWYGQ
jgi:hypothetical protein